LIGAFGRRLPNGIFTIVFAATTPATVAESPIVRLPAEGAVITTIFISLPEVGLMTVAALTLYVVFDGTGKGEIAMV
jgi:hypothetical protein